MTLRLMNGVVAGFISAALYSAYAVICQGLDMWRTYQASVNWMNPQLALHAAGPKVAEFVIGGHYQYSVIDQQLTLFASRPSAYYTSDIISLIVMVVVTAALVAGAVGAIHDRRPYQI